MSKKIEINYGRYVDLDVSDWLEGIAELSEEYKDLGRIKYILLNDEELLEINKNHLNHDYYTDIITFDYSKLNKVSGEIYVSIDRVNDNASSNDNELLRVLCHGMLHLIGFNDKSEGEKKEMRSMENLWINRIVSRES